MARQSGGSSTAIMEPMELDPVRIKLELGSTRAPSIGGRTLRSHKSEQAVDCNETLPSPTIASEKPLEKWNFPKRNTYKLAAAYFSFVVMGLNDATIGATLPYLQEYYHLEYNIVALVFLAPFGGYVSAAVLNNAIHMRFGQRGVAFLASAAHLLAYIVVSNHPPFPVVVVMYILAGLGCGLLDAAWNAWVGDMLNANELLGGLHGFYGVGAVIAPLIATAMITKAHLPWFYWYYCLIGVAALELGTCLSAFWPDDGAKFRDANPRTSDQNGSRLKEATLSRPVAKITWLCALFLLLYVGVEIGLGGWVVEFMLRVRHAPSFASGMSATGFWLGMTVGRFVLGFVTGRIGEKLAIMIYLPIAMGLELLFWLVPQFYVSVVAVSLVGFFLGPMFPGAVVALTKLLPKHLHVAGIGFAAAWGGSGGALFPYVVGAIAQAKGVQVLQPIMLALLAAAWLLWIMLPNMSKKLE